MKPRGEACRTFLPQMTAAPKPTKNTHSGLLSAVDSSRDAEKLIIDIYFFLRDLYCIANLGIGLLSVTCRQCDLLSPHD